ncbi:MAG: hypothetical protein PHU85_03970 [Phycisphaerae bacterium]|nr:hypothetical protein [Phycisphaerae bacterium]
MAAVATERFGSRQRGSDSVKLLYVIFGTNDGDAAYVALAAAAPASYGGFSSRTIQPVERQGVDFWFGEVDYVASTAQEAGDSTYEFDTGGGTQHITQSLALIQSYNATGYVAPESYGAIGVTSDSVEGCDITVPSYHFSNRVFLEAGIVTAAYRRTLYLLTGTTNLYAWYGFEAGEVLFLGASGTYRQAEGDWELSFKYAASPNQTGLTIGTMTGIEKPGWAYLWVRYQDTKDETSKSAVKQPIAAYVNQVYRTASWRGVLTL